MRLLAAFVYVRLFLSFQQESQQSSGDAVMSHQDSLRATMADIVRAREDFSVTKTFHGEYYTADYISLLEGNGGHQFLSQSSLAGN